LKTFFRMLFAIAATGLASTTFALATVTVTGDKAAWSDVAKAYEALNRLSGYRMKAAMPSGEMVMEFLPAKKAMHSTMRVGEGKMETVAVAGQVRYRMALPGMPSGWRCQGSPAPAGPSDPTQMNGTVDVARGADTTIDGIAMHSYVYTMSGSGAGERAAGKTTLYVNAKSGLPRRMAVSSPQGGQTFDYYDYGANIQIDVPSCS
jgi:hypothetical protein